ncbi:hypothetical protein [Ruegeria arenilitoris]|uniref:hypothetical protein n=1 Tax=Ruegeria arenilitoris TaxID=1173585 RepID=UPI00147F6B7E|nr:hypothetical protein [Ruegeria arenilitoris]
MSNYKMAVVAIHGMGSQSVGPNQPSSVPTFSSDLYDRVGRQLGQDMSKVAWHEVIWAQILQGRQMDYLNSISPYTGYDRTRRFVVCNLSDAASYRPTPDGSDKTYAAIHERVAQVIRIVRFQIGERAPILIVAHSLGGHIVSNYIYDLQRHLRHGGLPQHGVPVEDMQTVVGMVTFGCNIPIFLFAYPEQDITPIQRPNQELPLTLQFHNWWQNYYDKHDVLGFPLGPIAPSYGQLVGTGEITDQAIRVGNIFTGWNPFSHNGYWKARSLYEPVADRIRQILNAV